MADERRGQTTETGGNEVAAPVPLYLARASDGLPFWGPRAATLGVAGPYCWHHAPPLPWDSGGPPQENAAREAAALAAAAYEEMAEGR